MWRQRRRLELGLQAGAATFLAAQSTQGLKEAGRALPPAPAFQPLVGGVAPPALSFHFWPQTVE